MSGAGQGLKQIQKQQMRLNIQQMMIGRLLEMSTAEFEEEIVRALEENPALTVVDGIDEDSPRAGDDESDSNDEGFGSDDLPYVPAHRHSVYENQGVATTSDAEAVEQQLAELPLSDIERETAHYIIGNLDSSGYLTRDAMAIADDMAMTAGINVAPETVGKMIGIVKTLDPAGIGAENLQECLLIQLDRFPRSAVVDLAVDIIKNHFKLFIGNRYENIRVLEEVGKSEFDKVIKLIKSLNPKPGVALFDHSDDRTRHISPDFIIEEDHNGRLAVSLAGRIPELGIDSTFVVDHDRVIDKKSADFIKERSESANDFIEAVRRRGSTLMAIMKAIVAFQTDFFQSFDMGDLKPMVLRDIEEMTGFDKSVISRATAGKFMLTPDGMFSLKSLFSESASSKSDVSAREVETVLKDIIDHEDKRNPLTDDELTAALNERNYPVARRTVAKYRERLGIPVARLRRL